MVADLVPSFKGNEITISLKTVTVIMVMLGPPSSFSKCATKLTFRLNKELKHGDYTLEYRDTIDRKLFLL